MSSMLCLLRVEACFMRHHGYINTYIYFTKMFLKFSFFKMLKKCLKIFRIKKVYVERCFDKFHRYQFGVSKIYFFANQFPINFHIVFLKFAALIMSKYIGFETVFF